jgi:hypothetical protein
MNIGQQVIMQDGSRGIIVSLFGRAARICFFTPDGRLTYIAETHLVSQLILCDESEI